MCSPNCDLSIAFDCDGTLIDYEGKPNYPVINTLLYFHGLGCYIYVWSGGGIDYANHIVDRLGLKDKVDVVSKGGATVDISFDDDPAAKLGKVNIQVANAGARLMIGG
jgi:hydroxymethylpyrimidine pyrophosphatase-like HAD family hydrolase